MPYLRHFATELSKLVTAVIVWKVPIVLKNSFFDVVKKILGV
jgi:hypothetical protein